MAETETEQFEKHAGRDHYYNAAKNPDGAYLAGVPMRDMSGEEWDGLAPQQRREALHHGYWRLTPVPAEPDASAPAASRRRAARAESDEGSTAGSNAVPSPALDAAPPNPVGALEPKNEVDN
jgi:hypothetical protein